MGASMQVALNLVYITNCCVCGIQIVMPDDYCRDRKRAKDYWYCLNGHKQCFTAQSDIEAMSAELEKLKVMVADKEHMRVSMAQQRDEADIRAMRAYNRVKRLRAKLKKAGIK